tara:strand:+ start:395 stop:1063 length:669 start_codon:yes stop_codon:yes gene_type:complete
MPELERASRRPAPFPLDDRSLNDGTPSLNTTWELTLDEFGETFFAGRPDLDYLLLSGEPMNIVTHPTSANTARDKAELIGGDPSDVIKTLYFVHIDSGELYAFVVPNLGNIDLKNRSLRELIGFNSSKKLRFAAQDDLPEGMVYGICHPFLPEGFSRLNTMFFDIGALSTPWATNVFADFAINLETQVDDHQLSLQMPYLSAYRVLHQAFPGRIQPVPLNYN